MHSHTKIHLNAIQSENLTIGYQNEKEVPLQKNSKRYVLKDGHLVVESMSYYFANVELFDYSFTKKVWINFSVTEPSFFMLANLNNSTCFLCYRPTGNYRTLVCDGVNTLMLITFKADWFTYKCRKLPELESILNSFSRKENKQISLKKVGIARSLFKSFKNFNTSANNLDHDGYFFANGCINKYYTRIKGRKETFKYHNNKASIISEFILENFRTDIVNNLPKLADFFAVSCRSLCRLSIIAFGRPLHEQIIKLRMEYALDLLLETDKPIKEIAILCGYKESHYFSKAFKKNIGECPKHIKGRKKIKIIESELNYL